MKLLLIAILAASVRCVADEIRVVGKTEVNVEPLRQWYKKQKGDRPLAHWKLVTFIVPLKPIGSWTHCRVEIDGDERIVLVNNLDPEIKRHFNELDTLNAQIAALSAYVEKETRRVEDLDAVAPTAAYGTPEYVNAQMRLREQANLAANRLKEKKRQLDSLLSNWETRQKKTMTDIAMDTGTRYSNLPIWDCGKRIMR